MDSGNSIDLDTLFRHLDEGEHAIFRFHSVDERLFVDFRPGEDGQPAVFALPPARSVRERMKSVAEARPGVSAPEQLTIIPWPLRVGALDRLGVLDAIRRRLAVLEAYRVLSTLDAVYAALLVAERDEMRRAISGEGYRTLWPKPATH